MQTVVEILILGAGWTSTFLTELCDERGITYAATSRSGRESTIKFSFDPNSDDVEPYTILPKAHIVLITFPIVAKGASERLVRLYTRSHGQEGLNGDITTKFIQLGTSSIWDGARLGLKTEEPFKHKWYDRHSPYVQTPRAEAEDELLALSPNFSTTVINLSGLWGGTRLPRNWVARVAPSKEALRNKGSLHVVHGTDVARAILAIRGNFDKANGHRWLLSDGRVYDWWDLASAWGSVPGPPPPATPVEGGQPSLLPASSPETAIGASSLSQKNTDPERGPQATWVRELMLETGVRALPRDAQFLGRALDSRDFWNTFEINPLRPRLE